LQPQARGRAIAATSAIHPCRAATPIADRRALGDGEPSRPLASRRLDADPARQDHDNSHQLTAYTIATRLGSGMVIYEAGGAADEIVEIRTSGSDSSSRRSTCGCRPIRSWSKSQCWLHGSSSSRKRRDAGRPAHSTSNDRYGLGQLRRQRRSEQRTIRDRSNSVYSMSLGPLPARLDQDDWKASGSRVDDDTSDSVGRGPRAGAVPRRDCGLWPVYDRCYFASPW